MVRPGDAAELQAAIQRLLDDSGLTRRLGEAARRTVLASYSASSVSSQYAQLFQRLGPNGRATN